MAKKRKELVTPEQMIDAVKRSNGLVTSAAHRLGIGRRTFYSYMEKHPEVRDAIDEATARTLDLAENRLLQAIDSGDLQAIMFYLRTKGKSRGYTEKVESELSGTVAIAPAPIVRFESPPEIPANPDN